MPSETGVYTNAIGISSSIPNLGQWLRQKCDYETIYTGKWHLPGGRQFNIPGFKTPVTGLGGQGSLADGVVSSACAGFLRNRSDSKPFFMVCSLLQPHDICQWLRMNLYSRDTLYFPQAAEHLPGLPENFEFDPNQEPEAIRRRRNSQEPVLGNWSRLHWRYYIYCYMRMIEQLDREIGRVLSAVENSRYADNTLVILVSDHGEGLGSHQLVRKGCLYDEACRVPMVISLPGRIRGDAVESRLASHLDIVPTVCDWLNIEPPADQRGSSLRPLLEGTNAGWRDFVVSEVSHGPGQLGRMVKTGRFKYITYAGDKTEQLFDMSSDPGETRNLAADSRFYSDLRGHRRLLAEWESRLKRSGNLPADRIWRVRL